MLRTDLLEQIPHIASEALKFCDRVDALKTVISEYLLPLVVHNLGCSDNAIDKAAQSTILHLMDQGLVTKLQVEIQVCPAILANASDEQCTESTTAAITLMSKMAPFLGREVTERVFLKRFSQLCTSNTFCTRKVCASLIGSFCAVVSKEQFEKLLLPCYIILCQDEIWGVRKACADVIMFVSTACSPEIRRSTLAPTFAKLLQDDCRWVQMSAFQTLGPFISTFANPPITNTTFNNQGELVFVNNDGYEFLINPSSGQDVRLRYLSRQMFNSELVNSCNDAGLGDWAPFEDEESILKPESDVSANLKTEAEVSEQAVYDSDSLSTSSPIVQIHEDIKEMVETVKNAVLGYKNEEDEHEIVENLVNDGNNENVLNDFKDPCDSLENTESYEEVKITMDSPLESTTSKTNLFVADEISQSSKDSEIQESSVVEQVILNRQKEDDNLHLYNSYNYWYIRPDMAVDLSILDEPKIDQGTVDEEQQNLNVNDSHSECLSKEKNFLLSGGIYNAEIGPEQDIVPQILINHFYLMTDSSFSINIDNEMSYHCAYSLPAVVLTLEKKNWPLLRPTVERLASDMQYKVRRTVACSLHELAFILGQEIATEQLTPIFEGFIKDLDEVRIGILKHLAFFLKIITPAKRLVLLPMLPEFLKTENDSNWRFRYELAQQLLSIVTLFKPLDSGKYIGGLASFLLTDVSAVRQIAISVITELLRYLTSMPSLNSIFLVRFVEKFAHSKKWKRRQTFAFLCYKILASKALPPELFATEIMPHLLDLSWDPVPNVRLVVARTIAELLYPNEYFSDPRNEHFDSLGLVIRRLQADKDRDVRQAAETSDTMRLSTHVVDINE